MNTANPPVVVGVDHLDRRPGRRLLHFAALEAQARRTSIEVVHGCAADRLPSPVGTRQRQDQFCGQDQSVDDAAETLREMTAGKVPVTVSTPTGDGLGGTRPSLGIRLPRGGTAAGRCGRRSARGRIDLEHSRSPGRLPGRRGARRGPDCAAGSGGRGRRRPRARAACHCRSSRRGQLAQPAAHGHSRLGGCCRSTAVRRLRSGRRRPDPAPRAGHCRTVPRRSRRRSPRDPPGGLRSADSSCTATRSTASSRRLEVPACWSWPDTRAHTSPRSGSVMSPGP